MPWLYLAEIQPDYDVPERFRQIDFLTKITNRFNAYTPYRGGDFETAFIQPNHLEYELSAIPFNGGLSILSPEDALLRIFQHRLEAPGEPSVTSKLNEEFLEFFDPVSQQRFEPTADLCRFPPLSPENEDLMKRQLDGAWRPNRLGPFKGIVLKQPFRALPMEPRYYFHLAFSRLEIVVGARTGNLYRN